MSFVTSEKMLLDAQKGGYAVGAFNVENMEMVMAVIAAAEELRAPLMLQTTPSTIKYAGLDMYLANVKAAAERASVPVCLHLDHGDSFDLAMRALRTGYTSIMIDGSHNVFEENIAVTKAVADACRPSGIPVEAELGKVGGKEDDLDVTDADRYTDPLEAKEFAQRTGISSLAFSISSSVPLYVFVQPEIEKHNMQVSKMHVILFIKNTSATPYFTFLSRQNSHVLPPVTPAAHPAQY